MRKPWLRSSIVVALWLCPALLAQAAESEVTIGSKKKLELPAGETTEVKGEVKADLTGVWLVSEQHRIGDKMYYPTLQLYRLTKGEGERLVINWIALVPPEAVRTKLAKAQSEKVAWEPSSDDIAVLADQLRANAPLADPKLRGMHVVTAAPQFSAETLKSPASKDSLFSIESLFQPEQRPPFGQSYYIRKAAAGEMSGDMTAGAVLQNALGVPLPIGTVGTFRWIRLDLAPKPTPSPAA